MSIASTARHSITHLPISVSRKRTPEPLEATTQLDDKPGCQEEHLITTIKAKAIRHTIRG